MSGEVRATLNTLLYNYIALEDIVYRWDSFLHYRDYLSLNLHLSTSAKGHRTLCTCISRRLPYCFF
jgi:hypothetical protein